MHESSHSLILLIFSFSIPLSEGSKQVAVWVLGCQPRPTHYRCIIHQDDKIQFCLRSVKAEDWFNIMFNYCISHVVPRYLVIPVFLIEEVILN